MRLNQLFQCREVWSIGVYQLESKLEILSLEDHQPKFLIGERGLRTGPDYQSTVADPFLFSHEGTLYLFYEVKTDHDRGEIWAQSLSATGEWTVLGRVLAEAFHLSYPQVFECEGQIYMIPEAAQSGDVLLYSAVDFPMIWKKTAVLVDLPLKDPSIFISTESGCLLLGTTAKDELVVYQAETITGPFVDSGIIVTKDKAVSRCAGGFIEVADALYRVAQDCSKVYGERIKLMRVTDISRRGYSEELAVADLFEAKPAWMRIGSHHLSCAEFQGSTFVAIDGRRKDRYVNTLMLGIVKLREMLLSDRRVRTSPVASSA